MAQNPSEAPTVEQVAEALSHLNVTVVGLHLEWNSDSDKWEGIALGFKRTNVGQEWCTWHLFGSNIFTESNLGWGHYSMTEKAARADYAERSKEMM